MGLFDLLRSMVSGEKENVSQQAGFELRADSSGVLFFIEPQSLTNSSMVKGQLFRRCS